MKKKKKPVVYIYLIDELKHHSDDLMQQYHNPEKYMFQHFTSLQKFFAEFSKKPLTPNAPGILIFVANRHLNTENPVVEVIHLLDKLNDISKNTETIILTTQKTSETERKLREAGALAVIMDNENALLRIDNLVKGTISKHTIWRKRKASLRAFRILIAFLLFSLFFTLAAYFIFPEYF